MHSLITSKLDNFTPVFAALHCYRIQFKAAPFVFKAGLSPACVVDTACPHIPSISLRSECPSVVIIFAVAPPLWNDLNNLRRTTSATVSKSKRLEAADFCEGVYRQFFRNRFILF